MPASKPAGILRIKHVVAVASGKGSVGKSTTSCNLAPGFGILDADIYGPSQPKLFGLRGKPRIASIFDCALHGPSQPRYSLLFKPGLSLHPNSTSPARMWEWEKLRTVFWKCLHRLCHRALPS